MDKECGELLSKLKNIMENINQQIQNLMDQIENLQKKIDASSQSEKKDITAIIGTVIPTHDPDIALVPVLVPLTLVPLLPLTLVPLLSLSLPPILTLSLAHTLFPIHAGGNDRTPTGKQGS
ncbi:hypothetical protein Pmani_038205 [Petrolisthes manimaculis]|uniref:Uncharacterized protein n=1 Tax=Petrolisthes manimaculis TaxID=1843537 RepID=A0AAE1NEW1_9EUCA|nr:hypothetical protein Pmani_038205 [Petrolisthes manimaculis]